MYVSLTRGFSILADFKFVSCGMKYIVGDDWKDLFDIVIVSARKPAFYNSCKPFRGIDSLTGESHLL